MDASPPPIRVLDVRNQGVPMNSCPTRPQEFRSGVTLEGCAGRRRSALGPRKQQDRGAGCARHSGRERMIWQAQVGGLTSLRGITRQFETIRECRILADQLLADW